VPKGVKEGPLYKVGKKIFKHWQIRWFTVEDNCSLNYYEIIKKGTYTLYRKKGTISLRGCVVDDLSESGGFKNKQYSFCLTPKVGQKQKMYFLGCENATEFRDWLGKFINYGAIKGIP